MIRTALLLMALTGSVAAGDFTDKLKPHIGKPFELAGNARTLQATLTSVEPEYFCATVHIPDFEHERCYPLHSISFISDGGGGKRPFYIAVIEPGR